jgi:hypothetical protein
MLDIAISAALAVITFAMAYLGIHVTLHPPNKTSKARLFYKSGFFVCGCFMVYLVIVQGTRAKQAQRIAGNQIDGLERAKAQGRVGGRPKAVDDYKLLKRVEHARSENKSIRTIASELGIASGTVVKLLKELAA